MISPPRFAETVLTSLGATPEYRDAVVGDLAEELAWRAALDGPAAARRWYYREAVRSVPHLLGNSARAMEWRGVRRVAGTAVTSWVLSSAAVGVAFMILFRAGTLLWPDFRPAAALSLAGGVLGGYIAASLDRKTPLASAITYGLALSAAEIVSAMLVRPASMSPMMLVVPPLVRTTLAIAGALVQLRRRSAIAT